LPSQAELIDERGRFLLRQTDQLHFDREHSTNGGGSYSGTLTSCILTENAAVLGGGAYIGTLNNCILVSNSASSFGGGGYSNRLVLNCTVIGNTAQTNGGGTCGSTNLNSIVYGMMLQLTRTFPAGA